MPAAVSRWDTQNLNESESNFSVIDSGPDGATLRIYNATAYDGMDVYCVAENMVGRNQTTVRITVRGEFYFDYLT